MGAWPRPSFFWYDNDKELKVCFLVTRVKQSRILLVIWVYSGSIHHSTQTIRGQPLMIQRQRKSRKNGGPSTGRILFFDPFKEGKPFVKALYFIDSLKKIETPAYNFFTPPTPTHHSWVINNDRSLLIQKPDNKMAIFDFPLIPTYVTHFTNGQPLNIFILSPRQNRICWESGK